MDKGIIIVAFSLLLLIFYWVFLIIIYINLSIFKDDIENIRVRLLSSYLEFKKFI